MTESKGRKIRGVVFDKDGTLFDFARTWEAFTQSVLIRLSQGGTDPAILGAAIGFNTVTGKFSRDSVVIAGTPTEIAEALSPYLENMSVFDTVLLLNQEAARAPQQEAVPLAPFLSRLRGRGLKLGVATNDAEGPARAHLGSVGIIEKFDFIAGFDSGYGGKPEPGQLVAFCEAMRLDPVECVMVGDSRHDLRAGRAAGFATLGVLTGLADADELSPLADAVLPDIGHLMKWLDR